MSISVADVDAMPPGAELAAVLARVAPDGVDDDGQLLDMVAAWDRLISWAHANQLAAMAEFARRPWNSGRGDDAVAARARRAKVGEIGREFAHDEVAARLAVSTRAAAQRMWLAMELVSPLSATAAALRAGDIDVGKARVIADGCRNLDPATAVDVETKVLARAGEQSGWRLKQSVRRAAIAADPVGARGRWQAAAAERGQWMTPLEDGLAEIRAVLPAADALTVHNVLGAAARAAKTAGGGDPHNRPAARRFPARPVRRRAGHRRPRRPGATQTRRSPRPPR